MRKIALLLLTCLIGCGTALCRKPDSVRVAASFATLADDACRLRLFLGAMPKGGDLHNHLTGAIYAETYFDIACRDSLWIDSLTGRLSNHPDHTATLRLTPGLPDRNALRAALIDRWSVRNYHPARQSLPPDEHFFATFGLFGAAVQGHLVELTREVRLRAARENVQYLELMLTSPSLYADGIDSLCGDGFFARHNALLQASIRPDTPAAVTDSLLASLYRQWEENPALQDYVEGYVAFIDSIDLHSAIADRRAPLCRYQGYANRNATPLEVFAQLYVSYKGCLREGSKLVGVNILSPENGPTALTDYTGHMRMFRFLNAACSDSVRLSLHAGELTPGLVTPEELRDHIWQAVLVAGADRIGHGTDIACETDGLALLDTLRRRDIPIEINLSSNEFILGVRDDAHPFPLYRSAGVPTLLSTDDAGVLRTDLTEQYLLAVQRYGLGYYDLKQLARNSIRYAFLPEATRRRLLVRLEEAFTDFERDWCAYLDRQDDRPSPRRSR